MCGIWLQVIDDDHCQRDDAAGPDWLLNRGPDYHRLDQLTSRVRLGASILHIQGASLRQQPLHDASSNALAFNGELFHGTESTSSDTELLSALLGSASSASEAVSLLETVRGPFAFVFYHRSSDSIWVGRDPYGRRSLVMSQSKGMLEIASVCGDGRLDWVEVPCNGIFSIAVREVVSGAAPVAQLHPWSHLAHEDGNDDPSLPAIRPGPRSYQDNVIELYHRLSAAMARRLLCIGDRYRETGDDSARIGILFSGGLDCSVLAALAHEHVPIDEPIDLLNFAFGNQPLRVPDRQTSINSLIELRRRFPDRHWRLIEINVDINDLRKHADRIYNLIRPNVTVMDFNLGSVLWFSGRGQGLVLREASPLKPIVSPHCRYSGSSRSDATSVDSYYDGSEIWDQYRSQCRLLLSGLGADELFGGYARHRTAFKRGGWRGARNELEIDQRRLYRRNLGRDDRLLSDSARDTLYCYLDREVRDFVRSLPLREVSRLDLPADEGADKLLLRQLAVYLGLPQLSTLQKRAIQFGTRIANKAVAGTEILSRDRLHDQLEDIVRSKPI